MAGEDYRINGVNISVISKNRKIRAGRFNFYKKFFTPYNFWVKGENNNIVELEINWKRYYYGVVSGKIRLKGEKEWHKDILDKLNKDFNNNIPKRQPGDKIPYFNLKVDKIEDRYDYEPDKDEKELKALERKMKVDKLLKIKKDNE
jgi:hypothetical protein